MFMKRAYSALWFVAIVVVALPVYAEDRYVAPDGNDSNSGTLDKPFATVERAQMASAPGDTVFIRGGVYKFSGTSATVGVSFTKSGQDGKPINYFAYPGEVPIFDLFELKPQQRVTGLDVRCNWIHLRGLEVRGVRQLIVGDSWGVRIRGDHNVVEQLHVHDNEAPGVFITSGASNLILNCDSHHNYDPLEDGGNADGFGCHSPGGGNVLRGCRAYENSDDGFDFINAAGTCTVEGSWSFRNGYVPDTDMAGANGAGFKSGGYGEPPSIPATGAVRHTVRNNLAFGKRAIGFYGNHHPGGIDFYNNTAFDNPANFDMRPATGMTSSHKLRNNVAAGTGKAIVNFMGGTDEFNSWTSMVQVTAADFMSMDKALALMPRQPDGSLPNVPLMQLVAGSDLIDKGQDVGLAFIGSAPDLGAYEFGATKPAEMPDAGPPDASTPAMDAGMSAGGSGAQPPATGTMQPPSGAAGRAPAGASGAGGATQPGRAGAGAAPIGQAGGTAVQQAGAPAGAGAAVGAAGSGAPSAGADAGSDGCSCRIGPEGSSEHAWMLSVAVCGLCVFRMRRRRARSRENASMYS
jgi:MYXO-CTERM domain-containing protein